jgi:hypothetical protein
MDFLKKATSRLTEKFEEVSTAFATSERQDAELSAFKARIDELSGTVRQMKKTFATYATAMTTISGSGVALSSDLGQFYATSETRRKLVNDFGEAQYRIDSMTVDLFKDRFGWEVLKAFDDWEQDINRVLAEVRKNEQARGQAQSLQDKVQAMRAAKERRSGVSEREGQMIEEAEKKLGKYTKVVASMRTELGKSIKALVEGRYSKMDEVFVRVMEAQVEFFTKGAAQVAGFKASVENYRRRFPKGSNGADGMEGDRRAYGGTSDSESESDNGGARGDGSSDGQDFYDDLGPDAPASPTPAKAPPVKVTASAASEAKRRLSENSGGDFLDMFSQGAAPTASTPKAGNSSGGESDDFLDMFSTDAAPTKPSGVSASTSANDFFDMSGMATPASVATSGNSGTNTPVPSFDTFDPFGMGAASAPPAAAASKYSNGSSSSSSSSTGGFGDFGDMLGASSRASGSSSSTGAVHEYRAREAQQQNEGKAKDDAKKNVESKLDAWEYKGGVRKDIRALLSTLHSILWEGNRWKQVGLHDLLDAKKVKLAYRKSLLAVHPDKINKDAPAEHKVIAARAFMALNEMWQRFEATGQ